jgi:hypothetical protein
MDHFRLVLGAESGQTLPGVMPCRSLLARPGERKPSTVLFGPNPGSNTQGSLTRFRWLKDEFSHPREHKAVYKDETLTHLFGGLLDRRT